MTSRIIFTTAPFEVDDVLLGSLVPDVRYPNQDALTLIKPLSEDKFSKREQKNFNGVLDSDKQKSFRAQLTKLLTFSVKTSQSENLTLEAVKGWIYELRQPKTLFKELCGKNEVRTWLREGLETQQDSYFVVGLRTFEHAAVGKGLKSAKGVDVSGSVPVGEVVKANTALDPGDAADVEVEVENTETKNAEESFETEDELVYAIEYRKIIMKKRQPDTPILSTDNVWRYYSDNRVADGEDGPFEEYETSLSEEKIPADTLYKSLEDVDGEVILLPVNV
jgi:hypothetical protein